MLPSISLPSLFLLALSTLSIAYYAIKRLGRHSITYLPGPKPGPWAIGNLRTLFDSETIDSVICQWTEQHGTAMRVKGVLGVNVLLLSDPKALQYILNTSGYGVKRPQQTKVISRLVAGEGILFADADEHARQRRIMLPSFHFGTLRNFTPIFRQITQKTVTNWNKIVVNAGGSSVIEMTAWLSRTTLDALGETGFDYKFGALENDQNELSLAYRGLIADAFYKRSTIIVLFEGICGCIPMPLARLLQAILPTRQLKRLRNYMKVARSVAKRVVDTQTEAYHHRKEGGKDIMSILVRANLSENPRTKLTDDNLMSQMTTFMLAGHETTSTTLSWILYELAMHPEYQNKLREEIRTFKKAAAERADSGLTVSDLDVMKYLTAVVKETLRFHPIAPLIQRECTRDLVIPLSSPVKTQTGELISAIPVSKGQLLILSITMYNRLKSVWGEDANIWRPERFLEDSPTKQKTGFGVISSIGTFGSGLQSCIGWRFAMVEMQSLLIEFIENFEFSATEATRDVIHGSLGAAAPMLKSNPGRPQLPLLLSPVQRP